MDEIKRLQQLAGINEIKVNNPINYEKIWDDCWQEAIDEIGEFDDYDEEIDDDGELSNEDEVGRYADEIFKQRTGKDRIDTMPFK